MLATAVRRRGLSSVVAAAKGPVHKRIPPGDDKERLVCDDCGFINYNNPKVIVGCIASDAATGKVLLCRRAIEPRRGSWTVPGGFLEANEAADVGAARESLEEAGVTVQVKSLLAAYSVPRISQVHMWFRASFDPLLSPPKFGPESLEVKLFAPSEIPFDNIAFPSVETALRFWRDHVHDGSVDVQTVTRMPPPS